jgi:hypothetical protein
MATFPQITSILNFHGQVRSKAARVVKLAISIKSLSKSLIKSITPKTITIR